MHVLGVGLTNCTIKQLDVSHNAFAGNAPTLLDKYQHLGLEVQPQLKPALGICTVCNDAPCQHRCPEHQSVLLHSIVD